MIDKHEKNDEGYSLVTNSQFTVRSEGKFRNVEGMGWLITCFFIVGETAGGGLIALPPSIISAGLLGGVIIILFGAIICTFTGEQLSENWTILQERWPEYRSHCRKPYPAMGLRAVGPNFMTLVSTTLNCTMFGTAVVFLLLAARNIENFLRAYADVHISFCQLLLIVALFMLPLTMLKSPKDFWWAVIAAMITTSAAVSLIVYGSILDYGSCAPAANYPRLDASKFFMSFGTVMFAYGGHGAFPTIQHDMQKPYRFRRSIFVAFLIIFCMYLPVSIVGYLTYGDSLRDSIIPSIQDPLIQQIVNILITLHVILALTVIFNPLNQELEELLKLPHDFGYKRVLARTSMMLAVVLVAETIPNFGVLLDLVGGSTITMMALIFPVVFNLFLVAAHKKHNGSIASSTEEPLSFREVYEYTPKRKLIVNCAIILFALVASTAATMSAMSAMLGSEFSAPCYAGLLGYKEAIGQNTDELLTMGRERLFCCGHFRNVTRFDDSQIRCMAPTATIGNHGSHG